MDTDTERNKRVVRRFVEDVRNRGRMEVIPELVAPELVAAVTEQSVALRAAFADYRVEIVDLVAEGATVVLRAQQTGTHVGTFEGIPPTGARIRWWLVRFFWFDPAGMIAGTWVLFDLQGLQQHTGATILPPASRGAQPPATPS